MNKKGMLVLLLSIVFISFTSAWNFPSTDGILKNITQITNYNNVTDYDEIDPLWSANYTNILTNCGTDFVYGVFPNGTLMCNDVSLGAETDPYWSANWTAFNETWSSTFNQTTNDSINNYILYVNSTNSAGGTDTFVANYSQFLLNNESLTNYINSNNDTIVTYIALVNTSMKNYVDGLTSYDDSWINSTIDSKILANNNSIVSYILIQNNSIKQYILDVNTSLAEYILYVNSTNGAGSNYDDDWINGTIDTKILDNNNSIVNWVNLVFVKITDIVGLVGNWSADKSDYYTKTEVNEINTSVTNAINDIGTYDDSWINSTILGFSYYNSTDFDILDYMLISNWNSTNTSYALDSVLMNGSFFNEEATDTFVANYSDYLITRLLTRNNTFALFSDLNNGTYSAVDTDTWVNNYSSYYTKTDIDNFNSSYLNTFNQTTNDSINNYILYVNSTNGDGGTDTFVANYSQFLLNNESLTNYIESNNDTIVTYIALVNTSMKNYVDYVNSTNGAGSEYDDAWINGTIDSKILVQNDSLVNYILIQNNSMKVYISDVNTSMKNYVDSLTSYDDDWINGTIDTKISDNNASVNSYILYVNSTNNAIDTDTFVANYTQFILNNESLTNFIIDSNTTIMSILNNGSYFNVAGDYDDDWINSTIDSKILDNNNSITNTFNLYVLISTLVDRVGNWSADKSDYYTKTEIDNINTSVTNAINDIGTYDDSWINDTIDARILIQNGSIVNWISNEYNVTRNNYITEVNTSMKNYVDSLDFVDTDTFADNYSAFLSIGNWTLDKPDYALLSILNNGTYSAVDTDTFVGNYSSFLNKVSWADVNNGTITAEETLWNANYSTFLTHITWANVINGTLYDNIWTQLGNKTMATTADLNNGTYFRTSQFNSSIALWGTLTNGTLATENSIWNTLGNGTIALTSYVDAQNTSQTNYINVQNTSVTNALNTKLNNSGGDLTGNINVTNANVSLSGRIKLAIDVTNNCANMVSGEICRNSTGTFIKG